MTTTANDNGAATGDHSPVAQATQQAQVALRCLDAIPENQPSAALFMRVAARYFADAAEKLRAEAERLKAAS